MSSPTPPSPSRWVVAMLIVLIGLAVCIAHPAGYYFGRFILDLMGLP